MVAVLLGLGSQAAMARGVDLNLSNDTAQFRYLAFDERGGGFGNREADIGLLYTTDDDYLGMFGAQVIAEAGTAFPGLEAGVGLKVFGARSDGSNVLAIAPGGQLRYALPPFWRVFIGAEGFYSPRVVTFVDASSFSYFTTYLGYELLPEASVYVGYRRIRMDVDNVGNRTLESGGHVGMKFYF